MSKIEESKGGWPPYDTIAHIATHAPIQVQPDTPQGAFHVMQQGTWRLPVTAQFGNFVNKPPLFGSEWRAPAEWSANNNKVGEWDKWNSKTTDGEQSIPTFGPPSLTAAMMPTKDSDMKGEPTSSEYSDEMKSSEHTNSYDVSASQSPSDGTTEPRSRNVSEEPIDIDGCSEEIRDQEKNTDDAMDSDHSIKMEIQNVEVNKVEAPKPEKPLTTLEETQLLLNFATESFKEASIKAELMAEERPYQVTSRPTPIMGFLHSGTSAFSNIEPKDRDNLRAESSTEVTSTTPVSTPTSASFCRPPGLGPVNLPPPTNGQSAPLVCPICGFSCPSKFHYNSHMNTHGDHQCTMCDYTSRTEGRLKKHMRESHTVEEQLKAGLEIDTKADSGKKSPSSTEDKEYPSSSGVIESTKPSNFMLNLSTTMASILDSTANALAASMASTETTTTLPTSLKIDMSTTPNLLTTLAQSSLTSSALDQIRAFTENTNLLPEGGINLASALGAVSQAINGDAKSPEKQSNSETRRSSSGKVKILKCKQCGHQSMSKDEQWAHARTHIPLEKQLNCKHCNFVTEYKHHLEYHYRNHIGSKPFQCKKCAYTCVNKSMLNSHMKSHTNHYQFRCMDCTYATKYCHSLKLHLKKYNHRRVPEGMDMNGDTSPTLSNTDTLASYTSSLSNISLEKKADTPTSIPQPFSFNPIVTSQSLNYASQMLLKHHQLDGIGPLLSIPALSNVPPPPTMPLKCPMCDVQCSNQDEQMRHNMSHFINSSVPTTLASLYNNLSQMHVIPSLSSATTNATETSMEVDETTDEHENDTEGSGHDGEDEMEHNSDFESSPIASSKMSSGSMDDDEQKQKIEQSHVKSPASSEGIIEECRPESSVSPSEHITDSSTHIIPSAMSTLAEAQNQLMVNTSDPNSLNSLLHQACMAIALQGKPEEEEFNFTCPHCRMSFHDKALYTIHMGYHGFEHAFKCNRCGFTANDPLNFNLHLLQASHE